MSTPLLMRTDIFHGDPLAGMVTGLLTVVTTLSGKLTHS